MKKPVAKHRPVTKTKRVQEVEHTAYANTPPDGFMNLTVGVPMVSQPGASGIINCIF